MVTADSQVSPSLLDVPDEATTGGEVFSPVPPYDLTSLILRARRGRLTEEERGELERLFAHEHDARMAKIRARLTQEESRAEAVPVALQREVRERARLRCEYCLIHEDDTGPDDGRCGCMADLIVTEKHGGEATTDNLAYFCLTCNRNRGNTTISYAHDGTETRLFNPREDMWDEHFRVEGYLIIPLTPIAEATNHAFDFNAAPRRDERRGLQLLGRFPVEAESADHIP